MIGKFTPFPWVPDGIYDYREHLCRYDIKDGWHSHCVTTMWLNSDRISELPEELQAPWGTYPDLPPKPPKK